MTYRFGVFELDAASGRLLKRGIRLQLQQQPLRILGLLLERAGEVVTREEIRLRLWPQQDYLEFDNAINSSVRKLRDVLGDAAGSPRFIETLSRQGYRFIAPVADGSGQHTVPEPGNVATEMPAKPRVSGRGRVVVGSAVVVAIVGLLCLSLLRKDHATGGLTVSPLTSYPGFQVFPSFSPEGSRIAFAWRLPGEHKLDMYVKLVGPGEPMRLTREGGLAPAWSADGRFIAFLRPLDFLHAAVMVIPALGGQEREIARTAIITGDDVTQRNLWTCPTPLLTWSRDGQWLLTLDQQIAGYSSPNAITRISFETGEKLVVTSPPPNLEGDAAIAMSPDGTRLAFTRASGLWVRDIYMAGLSADLRLTGKPVRVTYDNRRIGGIVWARDGKTLIFSSDRDGRAALWKVAAAPGGKPALLGLAGDEPSDLAISTDGRQLIVSHFTDDQNIWRVPLRDGDKLSAPQRLIASTRRDTQGSYSPDGRRIAFESNRSGSEEIWTCGSDGSNAVQLTFFRTAWAGTPKWSPDGERVAFAADAAGSWDIYVTSAHGGPPTRLTKTGADESYPAWSGDGQWIYYFSSRSGQGEIWKVRSTGGPEQRVTKHGGFFVVESHDQRNLYVGKEHELWRISLRDGAEVKIADERDPLYFAMGRSGLYFIGDAQRDNQVLKFYDFKTQKTRMLRSLPGPLGWGMSVSPDEQWLIYGKHDWQSSELMLVENF